MRLKFVYAALAAGIPISLLAFSTGPPVRRTGTLVDGAQSCVVCHTTFAPANSDLRGSVSIDAGPYTPGVTQSIHVSVKHPQAMRWGFQLTARPISGQSNQAGTFTPNSVVRVRCNSNPAADAPCNGAQEFAEHLSAPFTNPGDGFMFSVDWTPPATDVGDVVFFAAGNAANGDRNLTGDRIYTTNKVISSAGSCSLTSRAILSGAVNAASFQAAMAPNALITIFGQGFTPPGVSRSPILVDSSAFPKNVGCMAVEIDGVRVPITYVQSNQINAQAPTSAVPGMSSVRVILNPDGPAPLISEPAIVKMGLQAPAFFTLNGKSVAAQIAGTNTLVASGGTPAKPGDVVSLYATGCGFTNPVYQAGEIVDTAAPLPLLFTVTIGGVALAPADVLYAGLAPQTISGLYQFNVRIPASAPDGDVPVSLQVNGLSTQSGTTIPVKR